MEMPLKTIPIVLLLVMVSILFNIISYIAAMNAALTSITTVNNTASCNTYTNITTIISRFTIQKIVEINGCIYIEGYVDIDLSNTVYALLCNEKVYILVELRPSHS